MVEDDTEFDLVNAAGKAQASERRIERNCSGFRYRTRGRRWMPSREKKKKNKLLRKMSMDEEMFNFSGSDNHGSESPALKLILAASPLAQWKTDDTRFMPNTPAVYPKSPARVRPRGAGERLPVPTRNPSLSNPSSSSAELDKFGRSGHLPKNTKEGLDTPQNDEAVERSVSAATPAATSMQAEMNSGVLTMPLQNEVDRKTSWQEASYPMDRECCRSENSCVSDLTSNVTPYQKPPPTLSMDRQPTRPPTRVNVVWSEVPNTKHYMTPPQLQQPWRRPSSSTSQYTTQLPRPSGRPSSSASQYHTRNTSRRCSPSSGPVTASTNGYQSQIAHYLTPVAQSNLNEPDLSAAEECGIAKTNAFPFSHMAYMSDMHKSLSRSLADYKMARNRAKAPLLVPPRSTSALDSIGSKHDITMTSEACSYSRVAAAISTPGTFMMKGGRCNIVKCAKARKNKILHITLPPPITLLEQRVEETRCFPSPVSANSNVPLLDSPNECRNGQVEELSPHEALELVQQCSAKNMSCTSAQAPNLHILDESSCEGDSLASPPQGASELSRGSNMWGGGVVGCSDLDDDAWWIERELARSFQKSLPGAHTCKSLQIAAQKAEKLRRGPAGLASVDFAGIASVEKRGVSNPGGFYGFLNRHSGSMSLLSDEDIAKLLPGYRTGLSASWSPSAGRMRSSPKNFMKSEELFTNLCSQPCTTSHNEIGSRLEFETAGDKMQTMNEDVLRSTHLLEYDDFSATPIASDKRSRSFSANLSRRLNSQRRLQSVMHTKVVHFDASPTPAAPTPSPSGSLVQERMF